MPTKNNLQGQSVTLTFKPGVKKEQINAALEQIYLESGCPACGLIGFDLDFKLAPVNPFLDRIRLEDFKGLSSVNVRPRVETINVKG